MLSSLGVAGFLGILGSFAAVLWIYVLRLGAWPGSALVLWGSRRDTRWLIHLGTAVIFAVESYLLLTFTALVIRTVRAYLGAHPDAVVWPLWLVGCYVTCAPLLFSGRDPPGALARDAADIAVRVALPLVLVAYGIFVSWPEVLEAGWAWLPELRLN
jgi:hypothetical protein